MAVRTEFRPLPDVGGLHRVARAFAYVLVVVTFTATAAYGGYVIGTRSRPSEGDVVARSAASSHTAVARAVAARGHADRVLRREAITKSMAFQRQRDMELMQRRLSEQHIADGEEAARAFARGRAAGRPATKKPKQPDASQP